MKKLILLLLLLPSLLYAQDWQEAKMSLGVVGGAIPAVGACTTIFDELTSQNDSSAFGNTAIRYYWGQGGYNPVANKTVCKVDVWFAAETGNADSRTFTLKIWTMSGGVDLNAVVAGGTSNTVAGSSITAPGWVSFTGLSAAIANGTNYAITVDGGAVDASNYFSTYDRATTPTLAGGGDIAGWQVDKIRGINIPGYDWSIILYE